MLTADYICRPEKLSRDIRLVVILEAKVLFFRNEDRKGLQWS